MVRWCGHVEISELDSSDLRSLGGGGNHYNSNWGNFIKEVDERE